MAATPDRLVPGPAATYYTTDYGGTMMGNALNIAAANQMAATMGIMPMQRTETSQVPLGIRDQQQFITLPRSMQSPGQQGNLLSLQEYNGAEFGEIQHQTFLTVAPWAKFSLLWKLLFYLK